MRRGLTTVKLRSEIFHLKTPVTPVARRWTNGAIRIQDIFYPSWCELRTPFDLRYKNKIS